MPTYLSSRARLPLLLAALTLVSACGQTPTAMLREPSAPAVGNTVESVTRVETVAFRGADATLHGEALAGFLSRYSPTVLGRDHAVRVAPATPGDPVSELRAAWAAVELRRQGTSAELSVHPLAAPPSSPTDPTGVILQIRRAEVARLSCRAYPRARDAQVDPTMTTPLGCTNTANLGRMVADPSDLVRGRRLGPAEGAPNVKAVEDYRSGKASTSGGDGGNPIAEAFANAFGETSE